MYIVLYCLVLLNSFDVSCPMFENYNFIKKIFILYCLILLNSFDFCCPIFENDNFIPKNIYIVLSYLIK